jgi:hypothetical protein
VITNIEHGDFTINIISSFNNNAVIATIISAVNGSNTPSDTFGNLKLWTTTSFVNLRQTDDIWRVVVNPGQGSNKPTLYYIYLE